MLALAARPLGKKYCHEQALRTVLYTINSMANKHGKVVEPLMSLTVDFYIRLFLRVRTSPIQCHQSIRKYSHIYQCSFCESFYLQPLGEQVPIRKREKKAEKKAQGRAQVAEEEKDGQAAPQQMRMRTAVNKVPTKCGNCDSVLSLGGPIWN